MPEFSLTELRTALKQLYEQSLHGCGNHCCQIRKPRGMGTNGPCSCSPMQMSAILFYIADRTGHIGRTWPTQDGKESNNE